MIHREATSEDSKDLAPTPRDLNLSLMLSKRNLESSLFEMGFRNITTHLNISKGGTGLSGNNNLLVVRKKKRKKRCFPFCQRSVSSCVESAIFKGSFESQSQKILRRIERYTSYITKSSKLYIAFCQPADTRPRQHQFWQNGKPGWLISHSQIANVRNWFKFWFKLQLSKWFKLFRVISSRTSWNKSFFSTFQGLFVNKEYHLNNWDGNTWSLEVSSGIKIGNMTFNDECRLIKTNVAD